MHDKDWPIGSKSIPRSDMTHTYHYFVYGGTVYVFLEPGPWMSGGEAGWTFSWKQETLAYTDSAGSDSQINIFEKQGYSGPKGSKTWDEITVIDGIPGAAPGVWMDSPPMAVVGGALAKAEFTKPETGLTDLRSRLRDLGKIVPSLTPVDFGALGRLRLPKGTGSGGNSGIPGQPSSDPGLPSSPSGSPSWGFDPSGGSVPGEGSGGSDDGFGRKADALLGKCNNPNEFDHFIDGERSCGKEPPPLFDNDKMSPKEAADLLKKLQDRDDDRGADMGSGYDPNLLATLRAGRGGTPVSSGFGPSPWQLIDNYRGGGAFDDVPVDGVVTVGAAKFRAALGFDPLHDLDDPAGSTTPDAEAIADAIFAMDAGPALQRPGFDVGDTAGNPDRIGQFDHRGMLSPAVTSAAASSSRSGILRGAAPRVATSAAAVPDAFDHLVAAAVARIG